MSTLAGARLVSRSDLNGSPQSSRASTPDIDALERLGAGLDFEFVDTTPQDLPHTNGQEQDDEEELEFRLFAPTTSTTDTSTKAPAQTIRLRSPSAELEADGDGGIIGKRPSSYHFTGELDPVRAHEYAVAALTGAEVLRLSKQPCPGCANPWKVISIPQSQAKTALAVSNPATEAFLPDEPKKRTRLNKKGRIKKREKIAANKAKKEMQSKEKEEKELAEKAKKARRNREKKFKKRARDKAKKAAGGTQDGGDDAASASEADSDVDMD